MKSMTKAGGVFFGTVAAVIAGLIKDGQRLAGRQRLIRVLNSESNQ
jgi:hypothetical protein